MTASPSAPAAMPSDEDVARVIDPDSWRHLEQARTTGVRPFIEAMERAVEPSLTTARAILALFAQILAEKGKWAERGWKAFHIASAQAMANGAAAKAAEAALAAKDEQLQIALAALKKIDEGCAAAIRAQD